MHVSREPLSFTLETELGELFKKSVILAKVISVSNKLSLTLNPESYDFCHH